jgi:hypothetical protein
VRRTLFTVLSAVGTIAALGMAALGICGCSRDLAQRSPDPLATTSPQAAPAPPADAGPLPAPEALSDVMSQLADPGVSGAAKMTLVQNTAAADGVALDRFANALRDTGFTPVTVSVSEIRWSDNHPGNVLATVQVTGPDSARLGADPGEFAFPMEFRRNGAGWQLTRETADELLAFGNARTDSPGPNPPP